MGSQVQTGFPNGIRANAISTFNNVVNFARGTDIASASTTDIGASTGNDINITGTTTITSLGTIAGGAFRFVTFTGALVLTYNATSLMLPTSANITTAAGDTAIFMSLGSGNWKCLTYTRRDGTALAGGGGGGDVSSNTATSVDGEIVLFNGTTGKSIKRGNALSGFLSLASGVASAIASTGTGSVVLAISPSLVTPILGTPTSGTLTNCAGLPISTGVSGLGANIATFLGTPSSANLLAAVTDETGTGSLVFATSPSLVTPLLGTPTSGTLTNCTGLPIATGVSGLGANVATFLATPSSANLLDAITDETGTGSVVFANTPTLVTPVLGVASATSLALAQGQYASATLTTSATTANQVIASISASVFRTMIAFVQITSGSAYQTIQVIITHDGTTPTLTAAADVATGASLASFDADISGGNLRLQTTPVNAVTTYRVLYMGINI